MNRLEVTTEKPLAVPIPERGREMVTTQITEASLEIMRLRLLDSMKNGQIEQTKSNLEIVEEYLKYAAMTKSDSKNTYHLACRKKKLYLVPDKTLEDIENVVNKIGKKKITRYGNPKINEPSEYENFMYKLDSVIEKLDEMVSSSESSSYESNAETDADECVGTAYPFQCLLYKLNYLSKKLDGFVYPLGSTSNVTIVDPYMSHEVSEGKNIEDKIRVAASPSPFSLRSEPVSTLYSFHSLDRDKKHADEDADRKSVENGLKIQVQRKTTPSKDDLESSKPIILPDLLRAKSLKFTIVGNFENSKPIFKIRKCDSEIEIQKKPKVIDSDSDSDGKNANKRLNISIAGKLLRENQLQFENNASEETECMNVDSPGDAKVFSFNRSLSISDLNHLRISISGQYIKDDNKAQYCPNMSIKINHKNGTFEQIYRKSFTCMDNELRHGRRGKLRKQKIYRNGEKGATDRKVRYEKDFTPSSSSDEYETDRYSFGSRHKLEVSEFGAIGKSSISNLQKEELIKRSEGIKVKEEQTDITQDKSNVLNSNTRSRDLNVFNLNFKDKISPFSSKVEIKENLPEEKKEDQATLKTKDDLNEEKKSNVTEDSMLLNTGPLTQEIDKYDVRSADKTGVPQIEAENEPIVPGSEQIARTKKLNSFANHLGDRLKRAIKNMIPTKKKVEDDLSENETSIPKRVRKRQRKLNICENPILGQFEEFFMD